MSIADAWTTERLITSGTNSLLADAASWIQCLNIIHDISIHNDIFYGLLVCLIVFNATFKNISVISWRSVLLVAKTIDLPQVTDNLYDIMLYTSP